MISELCISDLAGNVEVVLAHQGHIEAPNWHPDGQSLIVNGGGRIWRVPLAAPALDPIPTGFAVRNNNDHGPSPDGKWLAISDSTLTGASCIYVVPIGGGEPRRVTRDCPSWFHGWSPDGTRVVYPGARDGGPILIHACALDGSDERCLSPGFDHADGGEFTPDGAWIWFNGQRDGAVDLWRVRPNGADLQRMTDDASVNWFPHPSPDGLHILYLAYPPGTKGHPGGLDVTLRLMPQAGGAARDLVRLHGGQGSINVPCWAPDGKRFAFMRFRDHLRD